MSIGGNELDSGGGGGGGSDDSTNDDESVESGSSSTSTNGSSSLGSSSPGGTTRSGAELDEGSDTSGSSDFDRDDETEDDTGSTDRDQVTSGGDSDGTSSGPEPEDVDTGSETEDEPTRGADDGGESSFEPDEPDRHQRTETPTRGETGEDATSGPPGRREREELDEDVDQERARRQAAEQFDRATPLVDVGPEDVVFDGRQAELDTQTQAQVARERTAARDRRVSPSDVDLTLAGGAFTASFEQPDAGARSDRDAFAGADDEADQRAEFRSEAAEELGVREDDVEISEEDGQLVATADERGSIDTSAGVEAIPFAGSQFGAGDIPRDLDQLREIDFSGAISREASQAGEAVDRATILPASPAVDPRGFTVDDIPGAGAQIGEEEIRSASVDDIPGAGAQIGGSDIADAGERVAETAEASVRDGTGVQSVDDIPGAGMQIGADDISTASSDAAASFSVDDLPGSGRQTGVDDVPRSGDRAGQDVSFGESALALGAAGVVTPEPGTTAGGAALATVGAGALAVDAARQSEIGLPERGAQIGSGIGDTAEIETPEDRTEFTDDELGVGGQVVTEEVTVPEDGQGVTEIEAPAEPGGVESVEVPVFETSAVPDVVDEQDERFPTPDSPSIGDETGPTIEQPQQEDLTESPQQTDPRQVEEGGGVRFPADEASRPTVDSPGFEIAEPGTESFAEFESIGQSRPEADITPVADPFAQPRPDARAEARPLADALGASQATPTQAANFATPPAQSFSQPQQPATVNQSQTVQTNIQQQFGTGTPTLEARLPAPDLSSDVDESRSTGGDSFFDDIVFEFRDPLTGSFGEGENGDEDNFGLGRL